MPRRGIAMVGCGSVGRRQDLGAQFAMIESVPESDEPGGWKATHFSIEYDRRPSLEAFETSGMMAAGGVVTKLFYWELVTAEAEIILFMEWARASGYDPDDDIDGAFSAYVEQTGRAQYICARDPLHQ